MTTDESRREINGRMGVLAKACAVIIAVVAIAIVSPMLYYWCFQATASDHERVNDFANRLERSYSFSVQRADGKGPAVYTSPNPYTDFISIYGEYPPHELAKIEAAAKRVQWEGSVRKKVRLSFYKRELDESSLYHEVMIR